MKEKYKIIDFEKKGNLVRFYLGKEDLKEWYGDDWNDKPYECNAGTVYEEFIAGYKDVVFPFDDLVMEPADSWEYRGNSPFCKDDMRDRKVPCIIDVPKDVLGNGYYSDRFSEWVGSDRIHKFYFGDPMDPDVILPSREKESE